MYPLNETGWTQDQKESFRCYRTDIADTIMYCFNILRDNLLHQLLGHLDQAITKCHENNATNWPYLEACLYAWSAIGESLADEEDCDLLPQFLAKLPMIPYNNNVKVISSTLDCIGGFSEWLSSFPHLITHVIPIVTSALSSPELSLCSTMALKDMARDCTDGLKPFAKDILEACHSAMSSNQLKTGELIRLMYPVGKMLATVPRDQVMNYLQPILMPHLMELNTLSTQDVNPVARGKVICILKMLTTLFQALDSNNKDEDEKAEAQQQQMAQLNPAVVLFPQILPLIKTLSFKWIGDEDVMDAIWNFTKQSTSSLGQNLKTYAGEIMELMLQCYSVEPNGTALELARLLLVILGKQQDCRPMLTQLFVTISTKTLSYIQSKGTPSDHADLLATFFQVMATVMKRDAKMFDPSFVDIQALVQCANFCLTMPELGPAKYSSTFLANFITVSSDSQHLASIVNSMGETVFRQTILQIGGAESSNRTFVDYYVDILLAFNKKYFDNLCGWLNGLVAENGFPTDKISRDQKEHYSRQILRERANKRKLLEILREFSMACNGLIVSEDMNRVMATWDRIGDKNADKAEATAAAAAAAAASGGAQASIAAAPPR